MIKETGDISLYQKREDLQKAWIADKRIDYQLNRGEKFACFASLETTALLR